MVGGWVGAALWHAAVWAHGCGAVLCCAVLCCAVLCCNAFSCPGATLCHWHLHKQACSGQTSRSLPPNPQAILVIT